MFDLNSPVPPLGSLPEAAVCPFCDTTETALVNPFGGQLSVAQYWCRRCRTGFEYLKWEPHPAPPGQADQP